MAIAVKSNNHRVRAPLFSHRTSYWFYFNVIRGVFLVLHVFPQQGSIYQYVAKVVLEVATSTPGTKHRIQLLVGHGYILELTSPVDFINRLVANDVNVVSEGV